MNAKVPCSMKSPVVLCAFFTCKFLRMMVTPVYLTVVMYNAKPHFNSGRFKILFTVFNGQRSARLKHGTCLQFIQGSKIYKHMYSWSFELSQDSFLKARVCTLWFFTFIKAFMFLELSEAAWCLSTFKREYTYSSTHDCSYVLYFHLANSYKHTCRKTID